MALIPEMTAAIAEPPIVSETVDGVAVARLYGEPHAFLKDGHNLRRIEA